MTDTQLVLIVCGVWMLNGFALGMAAGVWYMVRQDRKLNGEWQ